MSKVTVRGFGIVFLAMGFWSCAEKGIDRNHAKYAQVDFEEVKVNFEPLPEFVINPEKSKSINSRIKLGEKLYFEKALSLGRDISCNSCHMLDRFGVDNEPTSPGHKGQRGDRNSPTVYNASFHIAQFWDGRAEDLKAQAKGPILNPIEMAIPDEKTAVQRIKEIKSYAAMFKSAFPGQKNPITYDNIADAIATFEKNLTTPSRFDEYLKGNQNALTLDEKEGLRVFVEVGCISCHNGVAIGGGLFQKLGVEVPYETKDLGRFNVTKSEDDKYFFKVPSLRNVVMTHPYFHDGSIKELSQAIKLMGKHQLGVDLKESEIAAIKAFLGSLTGKLTYVGDHLKK